MAAGQSLLEDEPTDADYRQADEYISSANARDGISAERKRLLMEFRRSIARTFQAEREMANY